VARWAFTSAGDPAAVMLDDATIDDHNLRKIMVWIGRR
jgi:hypothetical protein